jgi:hypothetical protein
MYDHRTPLPPCRTAVAGDLTSGDLVAGHCPDGSYPFRVLSASRAGDEVSIIMEEIGHASGVTDECHPAVEFTFDATEDVVTLPVHYGICIECGRLSPCPDELAERRLEKLWSSQAQTQTAAG